MLGKRRFTQFGLALLLGGACAGGQQKAPGIDFDSAGFEGFDETHFDLLAADCSYSTTDPLTREMTLTVGADETAYLFKRVADSVVVANANKAGVECTVQTTKKITINGANGSAHKVILDFYGGTFGLATTTSGPNIIIALGSDAGNTLKIRGTPNADLLTFGTNGTTSYAAISVVGATARTTPDISFTGVKSVVASTGAGNDVISGQGGTTLGTSVLPLLGSISMTLYGGDGNDTITSGATSSGVRNSLFGGAGNDLFPQLATLGADDISGGADTDTVDYSARTSAVNVTVNTDIVGVAAVGSLTCVVKTSIADNDSFQIFSALASSTKFAYQVTPSPGFVQTDMTAVIIDISNVLIVTDVDVAGATYTAIHDAHGALAVTATSPGTTATIALTNDAIGTAGNQAIVILSGTPITAIVGMHNGSGAGTRDDGDIAASEHDHILVDVENIVGSSAGDTIDASLSPVAHVLMGMAGDDTLIGAGAADYFYGGPGNDTLKGGAGNDFLFGGDNDDVVQGGAGNDTINGGGVNCVAAVSAAAPVVPYVSAVCTTTFAAAATTAGIDTLDYSDRTVNTQAVYVDLSSLNCTGHAFGEISIPECDVIVTTGNPAVASVRNIRGGAGGDTLKGDARDNIIWGGGGADNIYGGLGNDALYGEAGNDIIYGNDGTNTALTVLQIAAGVQDNDYINGGAGTNTLKGDDGLDTIDSSQGSGDAVDCGLGDGDINLPSGDEASKLACEL
jgi:Ca2+-binding RTX toxin-like protein